MKTRLVLLLSGIFCGCLLIAMLSPGLRSEAADILRLNIARTNSNVVLTWTNVGATLESSPAVPGNWVEVTNAVSPRVISPTNLASFFRLRVTDTNTPVSFAFRYVAPSYSVLIGLPGAGCGCVWPENPNSPGGLPGSVQDDGMGSVFLNTGELKQHAVDLTIPGRGLNWRFEQSYRSGMNYDGPLGHGWDFPDNRRLVIEADGSAVRVDGHARSDRYVLSGTNFLAPSGHFTKLVKSPNGSFTESDPHGMRWIYAPTNGLGTAKMTNMADRFGNQMAFTYNSQGQLTNVNDSLQRNIAYSYDSSGHLTTVTDFIGRSLAFEYDSTGDLISATSPAVTGTPTGNNFPNGKTTRYTYSSGFANPDLNHNLLTVTAPNEVAVSGPPRLTAQYITDPANTNKDRIQSLTLGGINNSGVPAGGTIAYQYGVLGAAASNDFATAVFQNTATNRNGNITEYRFNRLGNIVRTRQFTRGLRTNEPVFFETLAQYNGDGLMLGRTNAELDFVQHIYNTNSPDRLQQGNLLAVQRYPGPRGGDQTALTNRFVYETTFNLVTTNLDARGQATVHRYDASGNRTNTVHRIASIQEYFEYNAFGQMTAHILPDNGSASWERDEFAYYAGGAQKGYLASNVVDSTGFRLATTYQYDAVGNVTRMVDARGSDSSNIVNQLNQTVRQVSRETAAGSGIRYRTDTIYDADNNVVRTDVQNRDVNGALVTGNSNFTTLVTFDILNSTVTTLQEIGSLGGYITNQFRYDPNGNLTNRLFGEAANGTQPANAIQILHDERDLVFRQIRGPGTAIASTAQTDYDGNGHVIRTVHGLESEPRPTAITLDGFDRQTVRTDAMGNTITSHYDANGNLTSQRTDGQTNDVAGGTGNVRLSEVSYTYDSMDRPMLSDMAFFDTETQSNLTDGHVIHRTSYNDNGQVLRTVDDNSHTNTISYDTANRRLTVTDAKANTVTYAYDANNNATNVVEVDKSDLGSPSQTFVTRYSYDGLNRMVQTVDNASITNRSAYDSRGNIILATDGRGNVISNTFDRVNRHVRTTRFMTSTGDGSGAVTNSIITRSTFDDSGRMTQQTDDNGHNTTYQFDGLNRLTRTTYGDGTFITYTYDVHDNRISQTDPKVNVVTSKYDLLNRLTTNSIVRGSGVLGVTGETYQYDGLSRVIRAQNNDSVVTRSYDSLSHVVRETQQVLPGGAIRTVTCAYDGDGNQLSCTYPGGRMINWTYDSLDRKQTGSDAGGTNATYSYFGPFRVERRDYGNGTRTLLDYDAIRRLTNKVARVIATATNLDARSFTWDRVHNMTAHNDLLPSAQDSRSYVYDSISRLAQSAVAVVGPTNLYTLDGVGNRLSVTGGTNAGVYTLSSATPPEDYQVNQYTTTPFDSRTNNANGDLIAADGAGGLRLFGYDYLDRLVSYTNSGIVITNKYDCFGRRIEKAGNGTTNRYYYAGWQEIEEQNGTNATVATYSWGNGIDEQLTMDRGGQRRFFHEDGLGSIRKVTDATGSVLEQYRYDDYGHPTFLNGAGTVIPSTLIGNATLFTGRRYDPETALYYYRTRYLDSRAGRFATRDSIGIWGDEANLGNGYAYVGNDPIGETDPTGQYLTVGPLLDGGWRVVCWIGTLGGCCWPYNEGTGNTGTYSCWGNQALVANGNQWANGNGAVLTTANLARPSTGLGATLHTPISCANQNAVGTSYELGASGYLGGTRTKGTSFASGGTGARGRAAISDGAVVCVWFGDCVICCVVRNGKAVACAGSCAGGSTTSSK